MNSLVAYAGSERVRKKIGRRSENIGRGMPQGEFMRIMVPMEASTFATVRDRAVAEKTSFAQQVRLLVQRGLTAAE
jgi:hypothetical protein